MALCVFGSTLATYVEGQGYRAASETHKEAEEQIIDVDGDLLTDIVGENQAPLCCGLSNWGSLAYAGPGLFVFIASRVAIAGNEDDLTRRAIWRFRRAKASR